MCTRAGLEAVEKRKSSFPQAGPRSTVSPNHHADQGKPAVQKYTLTLWSRSLLQKPIVRELVKKFPLHMYAACPFPETDEYSPRPASYPLSHSLTIHFMLAFHLRLVLLRGLLSSSFPTTTLYQTLLSPVRATCHAYPILFDSTTRIIFR